MAALLINTNVAYVRADEAEENLIENAKNSVFLIQTCLVDEANEENYIFVEYEEVVEEEPVIIKKTNFDSMQPIYSEEELAELDEFEDDEENKWDEDIDYEEYDEYYD